MENTNANIGAQVEQPAQTLIDPDPSPASGADDQKPTPGATDDTAQVVEETTEQQEARKQSKFQRRLDRQKARTIAAETELRLTKERLAQHEAQSKQQQPEPSGEPKREDFDDYEAYVRAVAKHDAKQEATAIVKAEREASQRREQSSRQNSGEEKAAQAWIEREKTFQKATPDYEEVVSPFVDEDLGRLSDAGRRAIVESEVGPNLLHHLATNSDEFDAIADLSPRDQKAELTKLATKLKAPAAKLVTEAPAPLKPVPQGRSASSGYREGMSQSEYNTWFKAQTGARR